MNLYLIPKNLFLAKCYSKPRQQNALKEIHYKKSLFGANHPKMCGGWNDRNAKIFNCVKQRQLICIGHTLSLLATYL